MSTSTDVSENPQWCVLFIFCPSGIKKYFHTIHINSDTNKKCLGTILHFELCSLWSINDGAAKDLSTTR